MGLSANDRRALADWLHLVSIPGLGSVGQRALLRRFGPPDHILAQPRPALAEVIGERLADRLSSFDAAMVVDSAFAWLDSSASNFLLTLDSPHYPALLLELPDPPSILFAMGNLECLACPGLAVVGSRNATPGGISHAERFARSMSGFGYCVISGLALGIDAAAHRGALDAAGYTIAVVGTGIDRIYPARNADLARRLVASGHGLIISEFPIGTAPLAHNFPRRNRIISGLARGVLVVEAAPESGSLITARLAAEQGREVFAIPGSIHSPQSKGCHLLIKQGAKLVETAADILVELGGAATADTGCRDSAPAPDHVLLSKLGHDPLTLDELSSRSGLTAEALLAMLFELELAGKLACLPGGRYQRLQ